MKIVAWWGDGGYTIDVHAWFEYFDHDGDIDIFQKTLENESGTEDAPLDTTIKIKKRVFIWEKDHFKEVTCGDWDKMHLNIDFEKYHVKEWDNNDWWFE